MGQYKFKIDGKDFDVNVIEMDGKKALIEIDGQKVTVDIEQLGRKEDAPRPKRAVQTVAAAEPTSGEAPTKKAVKVTAPIPGVILKIHVREGDEVKAGQEILVMEAMKMENQIQATRKGKISRIHIRENDSVQQDDVLVEIQPS